jgi:hypothetical protein
MTDINQELEQIAAEVFVDESDLDEALDTKGDPRAPMKGAAPAQKEGKIDSGTPGGETQDMGPAVVSPDAPSDPGVAAEKKAKKATPPGRPGGKGLPSEAAPKTVAPTTMDGEVGDKLRGEEVEMETEGVDPEEKTLKGARAAEKKRAGKGGGTAGRPQDEPDEDEGKQDDEDRDDEEEATRSKKKPTAEEIEEVEISVDERVAAMDLSDDVQALTGGEGLSEEFKQKAATIFEAAVKAKIRAELERLEEEYAEAFEKSMEEAKTELTDKVDNYLTYIVDEWMSKNEVALEHQLKSEIAESFIADLRGLFEKHDITVPDDQFDLLDAAATKADELEEKLNETLERNIEMTKRINELEQHEILIDVASDLADTEVEKFAELAENVEYESADDYRTKLETIKDSYFPKAQITEDVEAAPTDEAYEDVTDTMAAYMTAIGKGEARAAGSQN